MKLFKKLIACGSLTVLCLFSLSSVFASPSGNNKSEEKEEKIPLSEVPQRVIDAAKRKVRGIVLDNEAEKETSKGKVIYELEGKANGKEYELEITERGKVLKVEEEKDDDNDDDDDDNDDDDN